MMKNVKDLQKLVRDFQPDPLRTYPEFEPVLNEWRQGKGQETCAEENSQSQASSDHEGTIEPTIQTRPKRSVGDRMTWLKALASDPDDLLEKWSAKR